MQQGGATSGFAGCCTGSKCSCPTRLAGADGQHAGVGDGRRDGVLDALVSILHRRHTTAVLSRSACHPPTDQQLHHLQQAQLTSEMEKAPGVTRAPKGVQIWTLQH
jgi:hypothetical protein